MKIKRAELLLRIEAVALALLMLLQLSACDEAPQSSAALDQYNAKWESLSDGSRFAKVQNIEDGFALAMRCWPDKVAVFRCLRVIQNSSTGFNVRQIARLDVAELPKWMLPLGVVVDGYSCGTVLGPTERIGRDGDTIHSNDLDGSRNRWSQRYVNRYIASNNVRGHTWFPCVEVLRTVLDGSLESLSTTSVTKADLGPD